MVTSNPSEGKFIAVYMRVSTGAQDTRSQEPDLQRWLLAQDQPVKSFCDKASGKTMDRPGWKKLESAMRAGKVSTIVCWRIDRLGRTARGLAALFAELGERKINLVSLREGLDLSTPAGRLMAHMLASIGEYETEIRAERVHAGQAVARANGKRWGGSQPGVPKKVQPAQAAAIRALHASNESIVAISKAVGLSRPTIYSVLRASNALQQKQSL